MGWAVRRLDHPPHHDITDCVSPVDQPFLGGLVHRGQASPDRRELGGGRAGRVERVGHWFRRIAPVSRNVCAGAPARPAEGTAPVLVDEIALAQRADLVVHNGENPAKMAGPVRCDPCLVTDVAAAVGDKERGTALENGLQPKVVVYATVTQLDCAGGPRLDVAARLSLD